MDMSSLASLYRSALSSNEADSVRERAGSRHSTLPDERTLQLLLLEGRFGFSFTEDPSVLWTAETGTSPPGRIF